MRLENKIVCITGASAGIGEACANVFAEAGAKLILIARRSSRLTELSEMLFSKFGTKIHLIELDVRNYEKVKLAIEALPNEWKNIDVLINNAGLAIGLGKVQDSDIKDWDIMIDTNVKGLLYMSRLISPTMIERKTGTIINIASIAGREVYSGGLVYSATKHAVKAITKSMALDLNGTNVRVCSLDPGLTETEFSIVRFDGDEAKAKKFYEGYIPLTGYDIADAALFIASRPQHVMIQDLLITPTAQASINMLSKSNSAGNPFDNVK